MVSDSAGFVMISRSRLVISCRSLWKSKEGLFLSPKQCLWQSLRSPVSQQPRTHAWGPGPGRASAPPAGQGLPSSVLRSGHLRCMDMCHAHISPRRSGILHTQNAGFPVCWFILCVNLTGLQGAQRVGQTGSWVCLSVLMAESNI